LPSLLGRPRKEGAGDAVLTWGKSKPKGEGGEGASPRRLSGITGAVAGREKGRRPSSLGKKKHLAHRHRGCEQNKGGDNQGPTIEHVPLNLPRLGGGEKRVTRGKGGNRKKAGVIGFTGRRSSGREEENARPGVGRKGTGKGLP